jgi:hypothetical protein
MADEIQVLRTENAVLRTENAVLRTENAALKERIEALEARLDASERACLEAVTGAIYRRNRATKVTQLSLSECPVCISTGIDCKLDECGHAFHENCLVKWISRKPLVNGCPVCRSRIL